jgi:PAS domain S-box-containing protein
MSADTMSGKKYVLLVLLLGLVCFGSGILGLTLRDLGHLRTSLWVPSSLGLAIALLYGIKWWPGIGLGTLLIVWIRDVPFVPGMIVTAIDVLEVVTAYWILRHVVRFRVELDRTIDVIAFVAVTLGVTLICSTANVAVLVAADVLEHGRSVQLWSSWWWSHLSGDLVVAPAILTCARRTGTRHHGTLSRTVEGIALAVFGALCVVLVLDNSLPSWVPSLHEPYYLLPLLVWGGLRFGPRGAALVSLGVCLTGIIVQSLGYGPFERLSDLRTFIVISTVSTMMLSTLTLERMRAVERRFAVELGATDGIVTLDVEGRILDVNPAAERLFQVRRNEVLGTELARLFSPPNHVETERARIRDFLRTPTRMLGTVGTRYRTVGWRATDRAEFPVEVSMIRGAMEGGSVMTAFIRDLTAQQLAETTLRQASENLERNVKERTAELILANQQLERRDVLMRQAEELAHLGSFDFDITHGRFKWSDELIRIYGQDPAHFTPTFDAFLDAIHADDREMVQKDIERALETMEPFTVEKRIVRPDGTVRCLLTQARVFKNGGPGVSRLAGCCQDITERRQNESLQRKLVQLLESSADAIIGLSPNGMIESWNHGAAALFGYSAAEVTGRSCMELVPSSQRGSLRDVLLSVTRGRRQDSYELAHRRRDGSVFDGAVTTSAVVDNNGKTIGIVKVIRDITAQKKFERSLRSSLREKDVLLQEIHHRVKNNLQVIASLLNIQVFSETSEGARQGLIESQTRIQSMALVHQLLYQSKDLAQIDFSEYINNLIQRLAQTYSTAADRVRVVTSAAGIRLDVDRAIPCGLILNELVTNALTHAFPDGRKGTITVTFSEDADNIILTVADDGIGLAKPIDFDDIRSFGLQIARTLAHQLDGTISLTGTRGTVARVTFPTAARAAAA